MQAKCKHHEIAELMVEANNYTKSYVETLILGTSLD